MIEVYIYTASAATFSHQQKNTFLLINCINGDLLQQIKNILFR
uniref:Uncharacterized protein n=1 Tax=Proteus mirabilis TaxID=584 RepID=A0A7L4ZC14_PROMI|nr:hypothetical protein [Proteus mirabilis]UIX51261.1 hypothetical protein [Providencia rettgeri]WBR55621.1 hypothetical protein [Proteus mirabilis]